VTTNVNDALSEVGAYSRNYRYAWSARNEPGKPPVCVLFLWVDEVAELTPYAGTDATTLRMDNTGTTFWKRYGHGSQGSNEAFRNLQYAQDECNDRFRVMWLIRDPHRPKQVRERYLDPNLVMELKYLDVEAKEFKAESVAGWNGAPPQPPTRYETTEAAAVIGAKGGKSRAARLSPKGRSEIARKGAQQRWSELQVSRKGNTVYTRVGFWHDARDGKIHMTFNGIPDGHVAVSDDPDKRQGHPTLFRKLERALRRFDYD